MRIAVLAIATAIGWAWWQSPFGQRARLRTAVARLAEVTPDARLPRARFSALRGSNADLAASAILPPSLEELTRVTAILRAADGSPSGASAAAVAHVIGGKADLAVAELERVVNAEKSDATLWNDLAAARYELWLTTKQSLPLLHALVAADSALRLDPDNAAAHYNRGLILDAIGIRVEARRAWEAAAHAKDITLRGLAADLLRETEIDTDAVRWKVAEQRLMAAAEADDGEQVRHIVERFPEEARRFAEVIYLASWATAAKAGDADAAARHLRLARAVGLALRDHRGESLLADAAAAIDAAASDPTRTRALADAHLVYQEGRKLFAASALTAAEKELNRSVELFAAGQSPMTAVAEYYAAQSLVDQNRVIDARTRLLRVLASERGTSHHSLVAQILWVLSLTDALIGSWSESASASIEANAIFTRIGETHNAASVATMVAEAFDRLGQNEEAWAHRLAAIPLLWRTGDVSKVQGALIGGERVAIRNQQWELARSLVDLELSLSGSFSMPVVNTLASKATVEHALGNATASAAALRRGHEIAAKADPKERELMLGDLDIAEGMILLSTDPKRAIERFTASIEFHNAAARVWRLPELYLQRGRAHAALGDRSSAWLDYAAGIDLVEAQREGAMLKDFRERMFDTAEDLFDEALALLIDSGHHELAFRYAERARARMLLEQFAGEGVDAAVDRAAFQRMLPDDALFVELVVIRDRIVLFAIRRDAPLRVHTIAIKPGELDAKVAALSRALAENRPVDEVRRESAALERLLFAPIADLLGRSKQLIIVPDAILERAPFAGLWRAASRKWLVEEMAVTVAPSASVLAAADRWPSPRTSGGVLVIGNPARTGMPSLPSAEREAESIAAFYSPRTYLAGNDATRRRFAAEAARVDVVHFAGHGIADESSPAPTLVFAGESGRMDVHDISRLSLPRRPLVVVAACGSLRGRGRGLDGTRSISSAFLVAGASTVVGTIVDIDDRRSSPLLLDFHRAVAAGDKPSIALQRAQQLAIARGEHPAGWTPFVVFGTRFR